MDHVAKAEGDYCDDVTVAFVAPLAAEAGTKTWKVEDVCSEHVLLCANEGLKNLDDKA